jgi:hypothetical protein
MAVFVYARSSSEGKESSKRSDSVWPSVSERKTRRSCVKLPNTNKAQLAMDIVRHCALCLNLREVRQSHIIPEFMFRPLYDKKHRFYGISSIVSKPNRLYQKGLRERLLCTDCEQRLSRHERYASAVFFGEATSQPKRTPTGFLFAGLNYKPFKLFLMSMLWRLAVTSIKDYKGAVLGCHLEPLRKLVLADDPSDHLTFPALVTVLTFDRRHVADLIIPPLSTRVQGASCLGVRGCRISVSLLRFQSATAGGSLGRIPTAKRRLSPPPYGHPGGSFLATMGSQDCRGRESSSAKNTVELFALSGGIIPAITPSLTSVVQQRESGTFPRTWLYEPEQISLSCRVTISRWSLTHRWRMHQKHHGWA